VHLSSIACLALTLLPLEPVTLAQASSEDLPLSFDEARVAASCGGRGDPCIEVVLRNHGSAPVMAWAIAAEVRRPDGTSSVLGEIHDGIESPADQEPPIAPGQATTRRLAETVVADASVLNGRVVAVVDVLDRGFGDEAELARIFARRGQRLTREEMWERELAVLQSATDLDAALAELDRRLALPWATDVCRGACDFMRRQLDPAHAARLNQPRRVLVDRLHTQTSARAARLRAHVSRRY
jgi:hypothetical protein